MIKAVLIGTGEPISKRIADLIFLMDDIKLIGAVERPGHPSIGRDIGTDTDTGETGVFITDSLLPLIREADVILYFAPHDLMLDYVRIAAENNVPIVIGTRGFTAEELRRISCLSKKTKCVLVPNVSINDNSVKGAIRAAKWVIRQANGLYDMQDVT